MGLCLIITCVCISCKEFEIMLTIFNLHTYMHIHTYLHTDLFICSRVHIHVPIYTHIPCAHIITHVPIIYTRAHKCICIICRPSHSIDHEYSDHFAFSDNFFYVFIKSCRESDVICNAKQASRDLNAQILMMFSPSWF